VQRVVIRHLTGSKTNQVEEFPLEHFKDITFGRDTSSASKYDPERDDLVSKQHAKIARESAEPLQFVITDLGSRNGTLVNNQRVYGNVRLNHGDLVQLGPGGPSFRFEIEPPPLRPTRPAEEGEVERKTVPPTREATTTWPPRLVVPPPPPPPASRCASFGDSWHSHACRRTPSGG